MQPSTPITVVLARFDDLFAKGLRELLAGDRGLAIAAADVEQARVDVVLRAHRPDVAILNADALSGPLEVRELSARHPATRLVMLVKDPSMAVCAPLLAFGASACVGRETQSRDVLNAIHLASRGLQVSPRVARAPGVASSSARALTARQAEVLLQLQDGRSNAQIAAALQIGVETVRTHVHNILEKLGVSSRGELTGRAAQGAAEPVAADIPASRNALSRPRHRRGHDMRSR